MVTERRAVCGVRELSQAVTAAAQTEVTVAEIYWQHIKFNDALPKSERDFEHLQTSNPASDFD